VIKSENALFVSAEKMRLVSRFVSGDERRYYLGGVFVEPCRSGGVTITAIDGHRLVSAHDPDGYIDQPRIISLPKDTLAAIKKHNSKSRRNEVGNESLTLILRNFAPKAALERVSLSDGIVFEIDLVKATVIDGSFPDYRRVVPETASGEAAAFQTAYLKDYVEISKSVIIHCNGRGAALIDFGRDDFVGVMLPFGMEPSASLRPVWFNA
jgi:DNA polymerase III sliding clamp (beta) subunit (PCNA family)